MMKVKYIDPKTGATGLYDGGIYEVIEACEVCGGAMLCVVDEDQSDWNYDNRPDWKPAIFIRLSAQKQPVASIWVESFTS